MGYGASIWFRMIAEYPVRVTGATIRNGNSDEGRSRDFRGLAKTYRVDPSGQNGDAVHKFPTMDAVVW